ncbi:MAG TPA: hypothetical protein VFS90_10910 [Pyrinomonadaceae bacterium]|nr:hypothetical protein [Pyrinomonadaceae bacterium]
MTASLIMIVGVGVLIVILVLSRQQRSTGPTSFIQTSEGSSSSTINPFTQPNRQALTTAKVQEAVARLTSNLRVGGAIVVEGIQELPQESAARADLRFEGFQYKSDQMGTPVSSDKQSPKKPDVNSPNFYDEMYRYGTQQVQAKNYSGPGYAVLKHYSDGRWVLREVHWQLNGWSGTVEIK